MVKKSDQYFNTTNEDAETSKKYAEKNVTQNIRILGIFKKCRRPMSPSEVWEIFGMVTTPLTSVRRGISQLKTEGTLVKTEFMKMGLYNRREYYYMLQRCGKKNKNT